MTLVSQTISDVTRNRSGGLISFGVLGALWAASGGVTAVMDTLNTAYRSGGGKIVLENSLDWHRPDHPASATDRQRDDFDHVR